MTFQITAAEFEAGVAMLESDGFKAVLAQIRQAWERRFADVGEDAAVAEDILSLLGTIPGLGVLGELSTGIKVVVMLSQFVQSPPNGGVLGAFVDSLGGVVRSVDNPGGAVSEGAV